MASVQELIDQLKDYRMRFSAKNELIKKGQEAVGPLIDALGSPLAAVRWSAASVLGTVRAKDAVPRLIESLKDPDVADTAADSLGQITGLQLGQSYDRWKRWLETGETGAVEQPSAALTDEQFIDQVIAGTSISASQTERGWVLRVAFDNRHQDVTVNLHAKDPGGKPLITIYTRCGKADPKLYEWALRQNVRLPAGSIAVADIERSAEFVVVDVHERETVTPELLRTAVKRVAQAGDQIESALSKADEF